METPNVTELLDSARKVIDGQCDCHTAEYRALDLLHQAVSEMREAVSHLCNAVEQLNDSARVSQVTARR